jgi:hypothetical protein
LNETIFFWWSLKVIALAEITIVFWVNRLQSFWLMNSFVKRAVGSIGNGPNLSASERVDMFQCPVGHSVINVFNWGHAFSFDLLVKTVIFSIIWAMLPASYFNFL